MKINKHNLLFWGIMAVFVISRWFGLGQIYHQDEYRWAEIAHQSLGHISGPHPPITEYFFKVVGQYIGFDYLRLVPLAVSFLNLMLVYFVSLKISKNKKIALIATGFFTVSVYGLIANLQIDIDGAILPFFVLLSYYFYLRFTTDGNKKFILPFLLAVAGGFLTKLSYVLFMVVLVADYLMAMHERGRFWSEVKKTVFLFGAMVLIALIIYIYITPNHPMLVASATGSNIFDFASRAYFDLIFKIFKSLVWLSPLLFLPVIAGLLQKEILGKYRIWYIYFFFSLMFYLVLFDFATLTIERYFMFLIIPCALISAEVIFNLFKGQNIRKRTYIIVAVVFIGLSFLILSLPHDALPLNPKTAYVDRIKSLDFRFLIPFTGGSGPSGFYFSALFIALIWLISGLSLIGAIFSKHKKSLFLGLFVIFGVGYNLLFSNEYLFGSIYGNVDKVAKETIEYVNSSNAVKGVVTYYDIGAYYLRLSGKYSSRFYTAPKRDYTSKMESYRGQYMIVDFPAIEKGGRYWPLISRCLLLKKFQDKKIESYVFDCSKI